MLSTRIVLAAAALLIGPGQAMAQSETAEAVSSPQSEIVVPVRAMGLDDAPVQIDFYSSFNCVECADWYLTILPELKSRYIDTGQARFVFHDVAVEPIYPSVRAAMIGLCADPAHFFDVAQSFMSGQAEVVEDESKVTQWYADAIAAAGEEPAEVEACAASEATYNMVIAQNADPVARIMPSFPGVMINGRVIEHPTLDSIASAILFAPTAP